MKPDVRFHILAARGGAALAIGPGKMALLAAIEQAGSISAAAKALGMSYRRAWVLVAETNRCLVEPAVATATGGDRGGGAALTDFGRAFLAAYRALEREARDGVDARLAAFLASVPPRPRKKA